MWTLLLLFVLTRSSKEDLSDFAMPKYSSALTAAITNIVYKFYVNESRTINIIYSFTDENSYDGHRDMINEVIYQLTDVVVQLEDDSSIKNFRGKKEHNIIFCDTFESFHNIFIQMRTDNFEFQGYFLIAISKYSENLYEIMSKIFESLWSLQIINANILWMPPENEEESMMYTYFPYTSFYCSEAYPVQLNQYRSGKWITDAMCFPKKMNNLYKCKLRVATFANAPFTIIHQNNTKTKLGGIDGILLRVLSQRMNFTVDLHVDNKFLWGDIDKNGVATGWLVIIIH